jgi:HD-like signal output (HDOD) protein
LASIVSEGLAPLPDCIFDLDVLLNEPVVDLKKVGRALSPEIELTRRILHLSNSSLLRNSDVARNITDAVVLLGPGLFHAAVLMSAVTGIGPRRHRDDNAMELWTHSVLMAAMSEKIAQVSEYPVEGMAFLAGLLHDIGHLPFLIVAREDLSPREGLASIPWRDNIEVEREIFGLDHCEIGRWMGLSWKFSPALMDAVRHHHDPRKANLDPHLAEVVNAAEHFCSGTFSSRDQHAGGLTLEIAGKFQAAHPVHSRLNPGTIASLTWAAQPGEGRRGMKRYRN